MLLCPFDKNGQEELVSNGRWREYVNLSKIKIEKGLGEEYIPHELNTPWEEVSMSYQTCYSWYQEDNFGRMFDFYNKNYNFPILNNIEIPVHIIVGTKDEFFHRTNIANPQEAMNILKKNLKRGSGKLIEKATHNFKGYENTVANEIFKFIKV